MSEKWITFAGRLASEFKDALNEYVEVGIKGLEMVEDLNLDNSYENVTCIVILDAGLHSLRDWSVVHALSERFSRIPILLYIRNEKMLPDKSIFRENVDVNYVEDELYISVVAKEMEEKVLEYEKEEVVASEGVD